ncbi:magnesium transporter CorA family protein [Bombilactobacillus bombi]|uniref:magnesium transporter CorA family protein n=1 Tax=Bombilactobacillus bombi TaxID=1303590 RepID=UPI0015E61EB6|nr:magnesium transporter CorA family protein [Bombilactobacillus bombi]
MIENIALNPQYKFINTSHLTASEISDLERDFHIDDEIIAYGTDRDESPNYIYDKTTSDQLLIIQIPRFLDKDDLHYVTQPIEFLIHQDTLFIFNPCDSSIVKKSLNKLQLNLSKFTNEKVVLALLFELIDTFLPVIRQITHRRNQLDQELNKKITNEKLVELSRLEQSLSFFSSAIILNESIICRLAQTPFMRTSQETANSEMLEDVLVECRQVKQMVETELDIVQRITETFNVIANNNLNDTMKFLTIWSLILTVPTIVTGFFGMNVGLPWMKVSFAWIIIVVICIILSLWLLLILKFHKKL